MQIEPACPAPAGISAAAAVPRGKGELAFQNGTFRASAGVLPELPSIPSGSSSPGDQQLGTDAARTAPALHPEEAGPGIVRLESRPRPHQAVREPGIVAWRRRHTARQRPTPSPGRSGDAPVPSSAAEPDRLGQVQVQSPPRRLLFGRHPPSLCRSGADGAGSADLPGGDRRHQIPQVLPSGRMIVSVSKGSKQSS